MQDFTSGSPTRQILDFSFPMLIGNVFQQVYSTVDTLIVGRYVSGRALAAVGTSASLLLFLLSVLIGLTTGASVVISQLYGARQDEKLSRTVSTSILFLGAVSVLITIAGIAASPLLLRALNTPDDILRDAVSYLRIMLGGTIFLIFFNMYTAYLRALGDSRSPLYILIASSVLNIVLDMIFVTVFRWGVAGAAVATVIAQGMAAVLCFLYAWRSVELLRIRRLVFDRELFRSILRYSIPAAIQLSMTSLAGLTIMRLVNSFGTVTVAGYTAATRIDQFAIMPLSNISMAISTYVAQNIGANREDRAKQGLRSGMGLMVCVGLIITGLGLLFGRQLIGMFVDSADVDAAAITLVGRNYFAIIVCFYFLFAVFFAFNGFFRGAGDAVIVMILTIVSLTLRTVCAHALVAAFHMGPEAVAWSIPIGWGVCSVWALLYYRARKWDGKAVVARTEHQMQTETGPHPAQNQTEQDTEKSL